MDQVAAVLRGLNSIGMRLSIYCNNELVLQDQFYIIVHHNNEMVIHGEKITTNYIA